MAAAFTAGVAASTVEQVPTTAATEAAAADIALPGPAVLKTETAQSFPSAIKDGLR